MRAIAFHLPQFHRIPENDAWWGEGFTEWENVRRGTPAFRGHEQPHRPGALGYYDLGDPGVLTAQASLAAGHGLAGFCFYHYWFAGRRLLGDPVDAMRRTGEPDFPFCLCWANESWTRSWDGQTGDVLIAQAYSQSDDLDHIRWLAPVLADPRYLRVDGRPLLLVYRADDLPDPRRTADTWRSEAHRLGVGDLFLARVDSLWGVRNDPAGIGFDAAVEFQPDKRCLPPRLRTSRGWRAAREIGLASRAYARNSVFSYPALVERALAADEPEYRRFRCVTPGWDNTARRPRGEAWVFRDSTPAAYERWLSQVVARERARGVELVFVNAWNEWGEGNHLEPCERWGTAYLEATSRALGAASARTPA